MYCDWPVLGRCCFCAPLRKGIIIFGYVNMIFKAFMIGLYSYMIHHEISARYVSFGKFFNFPLELSIAITCVELIFIGVLVYGAHVKALQLIKSFYYFALISTLSVLILQLIDVANSWSDHFGLALEYLTLAFSGLCMEVYLITLVRSLVLRLEVSGPHEHDNQLHRIVTGEIKIDTNGVYNNTTAPTE